MCGVCETKVGLRCVWVCGTHVCVGVCGTNVCVGCVGLSKGCVRVWRKGLSYTYLHQLLLQLVQAQEPQFW